MQALPGSSWRCSWQALDTPAAAARPADTAEIAARAPPRGSPTAPAKPRPSPLTIPLPSEYPAGPPSPAASNLLLLCATALTVLNNAHCTYNNMEHVGGVAGEGYSEQGQSPCTGAATMPVTPDEKPPYSPYKPCHSHNTMSFARTHACKDSACQARNYVTRSTQEVRSGR